MTFDDDPYDPFEFFTPREKKLHKLAGYLMYVGLGFAFFGLIVAGYSLYTNAY